MSDPVNEYGLGAEETRNQLQAFDGPRVDEEPEDLAHGLGGREPLSQPGDRGEDDLRSGLGAENTQDAPPAAEDPQPPAHGLGS